MPIRTHTRESYARRIERVLEHIDKRPDAALDPAALAERAHLSP